MSEQQKKKRSGGAVWAIGLLLSSLSFAAGSVSAEEVIKSHGISTFGDLKYPADFKHFDLVNPDAPQEGRMTFRGVGASSTFDSLNPFILKGQPAQGLGFLYDSLMTGSTDETDSLYGLIAESIEYPTDRSWAIFNLRPEARFSDGEPITAEDVVFTWEVLREKGSPSYQVMLRDIIAVEALSDHRVRFTFREDAPKRDLPALAAGLSILPKHYYETVDFSQSTMVPPVGSGAFVVKDAKPGRSIEYCRNPDYWGKDLPVRIGSGNFECYVFEYFQDTTAAFEAFKSGGYQFHQEFSSQIWATGYDFPALTKGWVVKEALPDNRPAGTQGFWFNLRQPKFQDIRVRQAIAMMFNFEWSNQTLFYDLYRRTDSFFENSPLEAVGVVEGAELALLEPFRDQLPASIFTDPPVSPTPSGERQLDRAALRAASALLDEAGWPVGRDGLRRNEAGEVLSIEFIEDQPSMERVMIPFVDNLKALGVDARISRIDSAQLQQRQDDFNYDIISGRFVMGTTPSLELRQLFSSETANAKGAPNFTGLADPVVDALIEKVIEAQSREEVEVASRALDRVLRDKQIWVPNWYSGQHLVAYWDVYGKPDQQPPYSRGDELWWWDGDKAAKLKQEGALR